MTRSAGPSLAGEWHYTSREKTEALAEPQQFLPRRNEAYPVFTRASSDQKVPWLNAPAEYDDSGQLNAYFRWKNVEDTPTSLAIQLWLAHPAIKGTPPHMPKEAVAEVTLRRLQQFAVRAGTTYTWQLRQEGSVLSSGRITPDAVNLLTIPRVTITTTPVELVVKAGP